MAIAQEYGVGAITASEGYVLRKPFKQGTERRRLVVWLHGLGSDGKFGVIDNSDQHLRVISTQLGLPFLSIDAGGTATWGNDTAISRVGPAITWAENRGVAKTDGAVIVGGSMGTVLALNYAARNPSKVKALALVFPSTDLAFPYANGNSAGIDTAYGGGAAYLAAKATHDGIGQTGALAGVSMKGWPSSNDTVVGTAQWATFVAAMNSSLVEQSSLGAVGHGDPNTVPASEVAAYIRRFA